MIEELRLLDSKFQKIIVSPIKEKDQDIGYSSIVICNDSAIGGGVSSSEDESVKIAIAEFIERSLFKMISNSDQRQDFLLDEHPTTSGFAAGFDHSKTFLRALCEATERWLWSKWIDEGFFVPSISIPLQNMTPLERFFLSHFDSTQFRKMSITIDHPITGKATAYFAVCLGIKGNGIFPGSRVSFVEDNLWVHPLVEAYRHLDIFNKRDKDRALADFDFIDQRIIYFGENKEHALNTISTCKRTDWPKITYKLTKEYPTNKQYYLWRVLADNYKGWHQGCYDRFVY
ncbi:MAG: hypothetical protein HQK50_06995 [Oligoflexia bacterium]|nr:hypothetical protein [Oligoflexia bacterium]